MTAETRPKVSPRRVALKLYELDQDVRAVLKLYATPQLDGSRKAP